MAKWQEKERDFFRTKYEFWFDCCVAVKEPLSGAIFSWSLASGQQQYFLAIYTVFHFALQGICSITLIVAYLFHSLHLLKYSIWWWHLGPEREWQAHWVQCSCRVGSKVCPSKVTFMLHCSLWLLFRYLFLKFLDRLPTRCSCKGCSAKIKMAIICLYSITAA